MSAVETLLFGFGFFATECPQSTVLHIKLDRSGRKPLGRRRDSDQRMLDDQDGKLFLQISDLYPGRGINYLVQRHRQWPLFSI